MFFQLVYISAAAPDFDDHTLPQLLEISRRNNSTRGITGLLLYAHGSFLQVLEGDQDAVEERYSVIEHDPRHEWLVRLKASSVRQRAFPDWSMGWYDCRLDDEVTGAIDKIASMRDVRDKLIRPSPELDAVLDVFARRKFGRAA